MPRQAHARTGFSISASPTTGRPGLSRSYYLAVASPYDLVGLTGRPSPPGAIRPRSPMLTPALPPTSAAAIAALLALVDVGLTKSKKRLARASRAADSFSSAARAVSA